MTDLGTRIKPDADRMSPLRTSALVLAGGSLFATLAISTAIELILKSVNPDGVDVTNGLAYLRPLLIAGWSIGFVLFALTIVMIVLLHRREGAAEARPAWIVFAVQLVLVVATLALDAGLRTVTGAG